MRLVLSKLFSPINTSSIALFRMAFGAIMFWEVIRYFNHGWIARYFISPQVFFSYPGLDFLHPWGGNGMHIHFMFLGVLSVFIFLGLFYRVSMVLFFAGFSFFFLIDKTNYLNHFYLISLLSFLMIFVPANRNYSLDALIWPSIRSDHIPTWALWLLRFQVGIAYFYGGIAKINPDWLRGEPMRMWLLERTDYPVFGALFDHAWATYFFSYGGLFLDLFIVPLLLIKRTRYVALIPLFSFHLLNTYLFNIGIFPWFMMAATVIFFEPDSFKRVLKWFFYHPRIALERPLFAPKRLLIGFFALYVTWQVLFPLRHFLYPGNVSWTEEGHRFSWHMKLRSKSANAIFIVKNVQKNSSRVVDLKEHLSRRQRSKMATHPDMILQFAHYLRAHYEDQGIENIEVYATVKASLNGRSEQLMVDPAVNLANIERYEVPATWIVPLDTKLQPSQNE